MRKLIEGLKSLWKEEDGLGTLEILLIVAVLVAIAIIFRKWIEPQIGILYIVLIIFSILFFDLYIDYSIRKVAPSCLGRFFFIVYVYW